MTRPISKAISSSIDTRSETLGVGEPAQGFGACKERRFASLIGRAPHDLGRGSDIVPQAPFAAFAFTD
jgi:hypothetical protein